MTAILWFTQDLRLEDNPALNAALKEHDEVIPVYVLDTESDWQPGGASRWWLHHSLSTLMDEIKSKDGRLILRQGSPTEVIQEIIQDTQATAVYFNRSYDPWMAKQQQSLNAACKSNDIECKRYNGLLLINPEAIRTQTDNPFQVFTPFYKHCMKGMGAIEPKTARNIKLARKHIPCDKLEAWSLLPTAPNWAKQFPEHWQPGCEDARARLKEVTKDIVKNYGDTRDIPAVDGTSRLSPHLHFGELSPRQIWHAVKNAKGVSDASAEPFLREVMWREFNYYLLHHWPHTPTKAFKEKFSRMSWHKNKKQFVAWQKGQTGYPLVDAGMRQLWATGWMHNRVRMVAASFLTKHLRIHWLDGARWFWDTLVDADLASNSGGWQWVAGSGADAAPYFRIFNPTTQAEKFDPSGEYIKEWVPELRDMPTKYVHKPWQADEETLKQAKVEIGKDYPYPIVDHSEARTEALEAYADIKNA